MAAVVISPISYSSRSRGRTLAIDWTWRNPPTGCTGMETPKSNAGTMQLPFNAQAMLLGAYLHIPTPQWVP